MEDTLPADAGSLERSYQQVLGSEAWQLDVGEASQDVLPDESRAEPDRRAALGVRPTASSAVPPPLARIIEALLFVGGPPLTFARTADAVRGLTQELFEQTVEELNRAYRAQGRPYVVQRQEDGWALALRPGYRFVADKFQSSVREARLSPAAVDVLAIVAYRQPVSRREVEGLRGHESGLLLRQLVRRGLVAVASRAESGGREVHYGTTPRFLELFGLANLDELPQTEDLQKL